MQYSRDDVRRKRLFVMSFFSSSCRSVNIIKLLKMVGGRFVIIIVKHFHLSIYVYIYTVKKMHLTNDT